MSGYTATMLLLSDTGVIGGINAGVIAPPPGELFSETNDNSEASLLTCGTALVLLACDAESRKAEYMASGLCTRP